MGRRKVLIACLLIAVMAFGPLAFAADIGEEPIVDGEVLDELDEGVEDPTPDLPGDDEELPGDDQELPGDDEELPGDDEELPGDDEELPGDDEELPGDDEELPGDDEELPGDDEELPGDDEELPGDDEEEPGDDEETPRPVPPGLTDKFNELPEGYMEAALSKGLSVGDAVKLGVHARLALRAGADEEGVWELLDSVQSGNEVDAVKTRLKELRREARSRGQDPDVGEEEVGLMAQEQNQLREQDKAGQKELKEQEKAEQKQLKEQEKLEKKQLKEQEKAEKKEQKAKEKGSPPGQQKKGK
ncbi:MAG: hypothetical protein GX980_01400 [Firmicutes bacterium]|nr:hypothetical protein [Bacillota bacterium]